MVVVSCFFGIDNVVMSVNLEWLVIMQDRKKEDFHVEFFLTFHDSIDFDNYPYNNYHTVRILLISTVKYCKTTLDFAYEKLKINLVGWDKE